MSNDIPYIRLQPAIQHLPVLLECTLCIYLHSCAIFTNNQSSTMKSKAVVFGISICLLYSSRCLAFSSVTKSISWTSQNIHILERNSFTTTTTTTPSSISLNFSNDPKGEVDVEDTDLPMKEQITLRQKADVIFYRIALISASSAYAVNQIVSLLNSGGGAGLTEETLTALQENSFLAAEWGILLSALFAPPYLGAITDTKKENDVDNALFLLLNELLPQLAGFAIFFEVVNLVQRNLSDGPVGSTLLENTTSIFISLICLREIGFFGASYKAEAILAIFLCIGLGLNDVIGFSEIALTSSLALCLLVLSFGKVFEPIRDDLKPNKSAFFKEGNF